MLAGPERARCVARLLRWVAEYESDLLLEGDLFNYDMIRFVDRLTRTSQDGIQKANPYDTTTWSIKVQIDDYEVTTPKEALEWVEAKLKADLREALPQQAVEEWTEALVTLLILITLAPKAIYKSQPWKTLVHAVARMPPRLV